MKVCKECKGQMEVSKVSKEWKCKQCGRCCKEIIITFTSPIEQDQKEWLINHKGVEILGDKKLIIKNACKHLYKKNGKYWCALHYTGNKPKLCIAAGEKECVYNQ